MNKEALEKRILDIEKYLNQNWNGLSDNFVNRLLLKIEYEKLTKQLYEQN